MNEDSLKQGLNFEKNLNTKKQDNIPLLHLPKQKMSAMKMFK